MTTSDERRAAGREIQGQLWPATLTGPTGQFPAAKLAPDYFDHVQQSAFGDIWTRPGLSVRDRSHDHRRRPGALGQTEELRAHLAGARNVGIDRDEIVEILMHISIYAGVPAAGVRPAGGRRRARHGLTPRFADADALARRAGRRLDRAQLGRPTDPSARPRRPAARRTATSSLQSAPPRP